MATQHYHWVCSYDIRHPKRLKKIHDVLSMIGIAINYSVFYLVLSHTQYVQLCKDIQKIIKPKDDVRLYRSAPLKTATVIGQVLPTGIHLINEQGHLF